MDVRGATFSSQEPGAESPGRVVADVLGVAAGQIGDPIAFEILVKRDDLARWGHGAKEDFTTKTSEFPEIEKPIGKGLW
jgi:hypothetical protein